MALYSGSNGLQLIFTGQPIQIQKLKTSQIVPITGRSSILVWLEFSGTVIPANEDWNELIILASEQLYTSCAGVIVPSIKVNRLIDKNVHPSLKSD